MRNQALDSGDDAVLDIMDLPEAHGLGIVHGVINAVALDLPVGLLWLFPAYHHGVLGYDLGLDVSGWTGRGLFTSPGFYWLTGRTLANCVDGGDTDFVLCVGVEATNAVTCSGDVIHCLILAVWGLGPILDDIVSHWVWVA